MTIYSTFIDAIYLFNYINFRLREFNDYLLLFYYYILFKY